MQTGAVRLTAIAVLAVWTRLAISQSKFQLFDPPNFDELFTKYIVETINGTHQ